MYSEENSVQLSGWMKALAKAMTSQLGEETQTLFRKAESPSDENQIIFSSGNKLDSLAKLLKLYPYNKRGKINASFSF